MSARDLKVRSAELEILDHRHVAYPDYKLAMQHVALLNRLTFSYHWVTKAVATLARLKPEANQPVSILEVGYGSGDLLRHLQRWARRRGRAVQLDGIDLHPWAQRTAEEATPAGAPIHYRTGDALALGAQDRYDIIVSSFVAHHLSQDQLVTFVAWMNQAATLGWFVHDIHRHPVSYHGVWLLSRGLRLSPIVRHDGPLSVARSFTRADWQQVLHKLPSHSTQIRVQWRFPFKYCVMGIQQGHAPL